MFGGALANAANYGPRPEWLVADMKPSLLKDELQACLDDPSFRPHPHPFSIGHRGACMMFPEHTYESYRAAISMGAGIVECDVAVTKDGELVCRHSECDLHTTTNILGTPLAAKCSQPFVPADPIAGTLASATCCTTDLTLAEFKSLCGKMDAKLSTAITAEEYMGTSATADWRTDLYSTSCPTLVSHKESITLIAAAGRKFTPELKTYSDTLSAFPYDIIRQKMVDEYTEAGVPATDVWPQSFNLPDILYWVQKTAFGPQAVFLSGPVRYTESFEEAGGLDGIAAAGIKYLAPPIGSFLESSMNNESLVAAPWVADAQAKGISLISWTVERNYGCWPSNNIKSPENYQPCTSRTEFELIDVLAKAGVVGIFSDWPATTTFYANCMMPMCPSGCHPNPHSGTTHDRKLLFVSAKPKPEPTVEIIKEMIPCPSPPPPAPANCPRGCLPN